MTAATSLDKGLSLWLGLWLCQGQGLALEFGHSRIGIAKPKGPKSKYEYPRSTKCPIPQTDPVTSASLSLLRGRVLLYCNWVGQADWDSSAYPIQRPNGRQTQAQGQAKSKTKTRQYTPTEFRYFLYTGLMSNVHSRLFISYKILKPYPIQNCSITILTFDNGRIFVQYVHFRLENWLVWQDSCPRFVPDPPHHLGNNDRHGYVQPSDWATTAPVTHDTADDPWWHDDIWPPAAVDIIF